jgi:tRNA 2-selenouridine synthase
MSLHSLTAQQALDQLDQFHTLIDARSESEYALDRLPSAQNWPTLNDAQRVEVGTLYNRQPFEAKKLGASMAAQNISHHISQHVMERPKNWKPLIYCWRGGKRSGSLALVLSEIGFQVSVIAGGYKAFRQEMLEDLPKLAQRLRWQVVCGTTGSGKTRLLHALAKSGAQVLDLEALAQHRSSVLGALPGVAQPSQKHFDMLVWHALRQYDPAHTVFVESESKKVGNVVITESLIQAMRRAPCINLQLPLAERVALLMEDYDHFVKDPELFSQRLETLTALRGRALVEGWVNQVQQGRLADVVQKLLETHYDPVYTQSMRRNYVQFEQAKALTPANRSPQAMQQQAELLLSNTSRSLKRSLSPTPH